MAIDAALKRHCPNLVLACALVVPVQAGHGEEAVSDLPVTVSGLRSAQGVVRIALCSPEGGFPDCQGKVVRSAVVKISNGAATAVFQNVPRGKYAVSLFHDANGNGRLDTFVGIPREGFGFSRNPPLKPRAPRFSEAEIEFVPGKSQDLAIRMRYIL